MQRAKLIVVGGDLDNTETEIDVKSTIVFGRGRGVDVVLAHPLVSRRHCEIREVGGQISVRDLGSVNGTYIDGRQISEAPLLDGDLLTVGTVTYRVVYSATPQDTVSVEPMSQQNVASIGREKRGLNIAVKRVGPTPPLRNTVVGRSYV